MTTQERVPLSEEEKAAMGRELAEEADEARRQADERAQQSMRERELATVTDCGRYSLER